MKVLFASLLAVTSTTGAVYGLHNNDTIKYGGVVCRATTTTNKTPFLNCVRPNGENIAISKKFVTVLKSDGFFFAYQEGQVK